MVVLGNVVQMACDGLWDVLSNQAAVDFVRRSLKRGMSVDDSVHAVAKEALRRGVRSLRCNVLVARFLSLMVVRVQSTDNVSALLISFTSRPGFVWMSKEADTTLGRDTAGTSGHSSSPMLAPTRPGLRLSRAGLATLAAALKTAQADS